MNLVSGFIVTSMASFISVSFALIGCRIVLEYMNIFMRLFELNFYGLMYDHLLILLFVRIF